MNRTYEEVSVIKGTFSGLKREGWQLHSENTPAKIVYLHNGSIDQKIWARDGGWHREAGPAFIQYRPGRVFPGDTRTFDQLKRDGAVLGEMWARHDKEHREDGPVDIEYNIDGSIYEEIWARDGKRVIKRFT